MWTLSPLISMDGGGPLLLKYYWVSFSEPASVNKIYFKKRPNFSVTFSNNLIHRWGRPYKCYTRVTKSYARLGIYYQFQLCKTQPNSVNEQDHRKCYLVALSLASNYRALASSLVLENRNYNRLAMFFTFHRHKFICFIYLLIYMIILLRL